MLSERNYFLNVWKSPLSQKDPVIVPAPLCMYSTEEHTSKFLCASSQVHTHILGKQFQAALTGVRCSAISRSAF